MGDKEIFFFTLVNFRFMFTVEKIVIEPKEFFKFHSCDGEKSMGKKLKIGVIGSRRRNAKSDRKVVERIVKKHSDAVFVSGGCPKGADRFVAEICAEKNLSLIEFLPDFPPKGSPRFEWARACYYRNQKIAENSDVVYALVASDRKGGTEDTIRRALKLGKKVVVK